MFRFISGLRAGRPGPQSVARRPRASRPRVEGIEDRVLLSITLHQDLANPGRNGSVITHVQVENVFWGDGFADPSRDKPTADDLDTFTRYIVTSPFMDTLAQYGVGHGAFRGSITLTDVPTTGYIGPDQIQSTLDRLISAGKLPPWGPSQLFVVYMPPGVSIGAPGYHSDNYTDSAIPDPATGLLKYNDHIFAAVASPGPGEANTVVASHELAETVTDPRLDAWYDGQHEEVADLATPATGVVGGYTVTELWSNADNRIVVPGSTGTPPAPTANTPGSTVDTSAQISTSTQTPPSDPSPTATPDPARIVAPVFRGERRVKSTFGKSRRRTTAFRLSFDAPLSAAAGNTALYQVEQVVGRGRHGQKLLPVRVRSAVLGDQGESVTLVLGPYRANKPLQLTATGLTGANGTSVAAFEAGL